MINRIITLHSWPRAIAHIDADAFFASVEQALHPEFKGKPVITGAERGIVAAASYEAKAMGVKRGVSLSEVTQICPQCILLPSDYETYSLFSKRMFSILRRFSPQVEEYSIDEAFVDLTGTRRIHRTGYKEIGQMMKEAIENELGITVSVGISLSKSLAKLCSKFRKPNGLTSVRGRHIHLLLGHTKLEQIWGFGPNTVALLEKHDLKTALDFVEKDESFAERLLGKVGVDIWNELRGEYMYQINPELSHKQASISKFKTFTPPSTKRTEVFARALRNLESACIKARRHGLATKRIIVVLRRQDFSSNGMEAKLNRPTSSPLELMEPFKELFDQVYKPGIQYRATGVVLAELTDSPSFQLGLFEDPVRAIQTREVFRAVDEVNRRYGKHTVFIADGLDIGQQHIGNRGRTARRKTDLLKGETFRQHLKIPLLH
jgi:DNA polymerase-4/DNA polymerase V